MKNKDKEKLVKEMTDLINKLKLDILEKEKILDNLTNNRND